MKTSFELAAEFRTTQGKGASRRLRRAGQAPAIMYGGGQPPQALALEHRKLIQLLDNERFYSTILNVQLDGKSQMAVLRDVQRHPAKNVILHMDLQRVIETETLRMQVPLHFTGEAVAPGVKTQGGIVSHQVSQVEVMCLPKDLPEFIEVDVSEMSLGQTLHFSDLKLPEGIELVELTHGRDAPVVSIHSPRAEEAEATPAADAAAPVEGAAAPAADAPAAAEGAKKEGGKK